MSHEPTTGMYSDSTGHDWLCIVGKDGLIRCYGKSTENLFHFTCGNVVTFHKWGWTKKPSATPSGTDKGRVLFEIIDVCPAELRSPWYRAYTVETADYDSDKATFWINEGIGLDEFIQSHTDIELPGWYVIEGITIKWSRDYDGDVDEDINFDIVRRATEQEIAEGVLADAIQGAQAVSNVTPIRPPDPQSEAGILARLERWQSTFSHILPGGRENPHNDMAYLMRDAIECIKGLRQYVRHLEADFTKESRHD